MGGNNENSKKSAYSSELEEYMNEQEEYSEDNSNSDDDSNFQASNIGSSKLDDYLGLDDEEEGEQLNYCSICGAELEKFNYGDKCDDCVKRIELVGEINKLLDYIAPSEKLDREILLRAGFDELELNILVSNLLNENLVVLGSNGVFLADVKTLNEFFRRYGSNNDILDESLYKNVMFSDDFIDISKYSDLVQLVFNSKRNKWELKLYRDGKSIITKYFVNILDANNHATHYLKEMGELDNLRDKQPVMPQEVKYRRSRHEFVFFSTTRNKWYVKVKGHVGSKFVGFYGTEEEAVIARDEYIRKKRENQAKLRPRRRKNVSDAIISFQEKSNQWIVKVKRKRGGFKRLGYYDTEEEAIAARDEYYGIGVESESTEQSTFSEGDRVQVISGNFEFEFGIIKGYNEERDSYIVDLENAIVPFPVLLTSDKFKLV